jgi:hypothetical protein
MSSPIAIRRLWFSIACAAEELERELTRRRKRRADAALARRFRREFIAAACALGAILLGAAAMAYFF